MDLTRFLGFSPETEVSLAPNRPFPTDDDVAFARKNDAYRYTGEVPRNTRQISNEELGDTNSTMGIRTLTEMGMLGAPDDPNILNSLAKNQLASRRSAIASLGYNDPNDLVTAAKDFQFDGFAGKTIQEDDHPLFSFFGAGEDAQSTPTHEAAHRGMMKLVDEIMNMPNSPETSRIRDYYRDPRTQEYAVRALMADKYGDVERDRGMPQKYKDLFDNPLFSDSLQEARRVNALAETLAARMIQQRNPGGPR